MPKSKAPSAPVGRPSKYDPKFIPVMLKLASEGKGLPQYASAFGVSKATVQQWCVDHEDFSVAYQQARTLSENWWMELARNKACGKKSNGSDTILKFMLSASFGMREKTDVTSDINANVNHTIAIQEFGED